MQISENYIRYTDKELLMRIVEQDIEAFSAFYDRHSPRLYGLALKILKDQILAEDVLQEVFMTIWKKCGQFDPRRGNLLGWITILCRNRAIDALRVLQKGKNRSFELNEEMYLGNSGDDDFNDPLKSINHQETQFIISRALENLPEEQKQPIRMAFFEGFSQTEISRSLNLPLGTVKTRIRLGMQKLRDLLLNISYK